MNLRRNLRAERRRRKKKLEREVDMIMKLMDTDPVKVPDGYCPLPEVVDREKFDAGIQLFTRKHGLTEEEIEQCRVDGANSVGRS